LFPQLSLLGEVIKPRVVLVQDIWGLLWNVATHGIHPQTSWNTGGPC